MDDDDGAFGGGVYVAFHDAATFGKSFMKSLDRVLRYDLRAPPRWAKLIGQPCGVGGFGVASLFAASRPTAAVTSVPANAPTMKEPAPSRISQILSATTGESPCCLMIALLMLEPFAGEADFGVVQRRADADQRLQPLSIRAKR